jgi:hypothetical protein
MGTRKFLKASVKYSLILGVFTFLSVGFLGLSHADMTMGPNGQMSSNCPFMPGMASLCQMNPLEHIAAWQNMFTAVPSQNDVLLLLASLLALALGALCITRYGTAPPKVFASQSSFVYYKRYIPIVSPLREAFSNGILHPKLF